MRTIRLIHSALILLFRLVFCASDPLGPSYLAEADLALVFFSILDTINVTEHLASNVTDERHAFFHKIHLIF